jgi:hypothetical protein
VSQLLPARATVCEGGRARRGHSFVPRDQHKVGKHSFVCLGAKMLKTKNVPCA